MNQILHILKKDLRRYAWAWITLFGCAGIEIYLHGTTAGMLESGLNQGLGMLTSMVGGILFFFVIIMVVQEETLADPDAYWLSRPISRGKLLASKLLFVLILVGIYQVSDLITLTMNDGAARAPYALLSTLTALALWQSQVFLAAQTRSLPRYLLLAVCLLIGFYTFSFVMLFLAMAGDTFFFDFNFDPGQLPADLPPHWLALIQTLYWLIIGLGLLSLIYLRRRFLLAWGLLIPAILCAVLLTPSNSYLGVNPKVTFEDDSISLKLSHLSRGGTMHTNGEEFIGVRAIFKISQENESGDLWTTINATTIRIDGRTLELDDNMTSQRFQEESGGLSSILLGYVKRSDLNGDEANLAIDFNLNITFSKQVEVGNLPIDQGATFVDNGNRLVVRSIYQDDNETKINLAATLPQYSFEPKSIASNNEAFEGKFSFALADSNGRHLQDFRLSMNFEGMGLVTSGTIEAFLPEEASLGDYRITIFAREITGSTFEFIKSSDISFKK